MASLRVFFRELAQHVVNTLAEDAPATEGAPILLGPVAPVRTTDTADTGERVRPSPEIPDDWTPSASSIWDWPDLTEADDPIEERPIQSPLRETPPPPPPRWDWYGAARSSSDPPATSHVKPESTTSSDLLTAVQLMGQQLSEQNRRMEQALHAVAERPVNVNIDASNLAPGTNPASNNDQATKTTPFQETPSTTTFGVKDPPLPNFKIDLGSAMGQRGGDGGRLCDQLSALTEIRRSFKEYVNGTHRMPRGESDIFNNDLGQHVLDAASDLFHAYVMCADTLEKQGITPLSVPQPELPALTKHYLNRLLPTLRERVPKFYWDAVPAAIWQQCTAYQKLVGIMFVYHQRLDVQMPKQAKKAIGYLRAGPWPSGVERSQTTLERWWLTITEVNELRPVKSELRVTLHDIADGLRAVNDIVGSNELIPRDVKSTVDALAAHCHLDAWHLEADKLTELYGTLHHLLGQYGTGGLKTYVPYRPAGGGGGQPKVPFKVPPPKRTSVTDPRLQAGSPAILTPKSPTPNGGNPAARVGKGGGGKGGIPAGKSTQTAKTGTQRTPYGLCHNWYKYGRCDYGDGCKYSHDPAKRQKAQACPAFTTRGECTLEDTCWYHHSKKARKAYLASLATQPDETQSPEATQGGAAAMMSSTDPHAQPDQDGMTYEEFQSYMSMMSETVLDQLPGESVGPVGSSDFP